MRHRRLPHIVQDMITKVSANITTVFTTLPSEIGTNFSAASDVDSDLYDAAIEAGPNESIVSFNGVTVNAETLDDLPLTAIKGSDTFTLVVSHDTDPALTVTWQGSLREMMKSANNTTVIATAVTEG